jgi:hypothetical protein
VWTIRVAFLTLSLLASSHAATHRSAAEVLAFKQHNPCPATGQARGACPGWLVDHAVPLCAGGEDKPSNMHWLSVEDHRFKTLVDVRECRKLRRNAGRPADWNSK